jgi:hypothetical protein
VLALGAAVAGVALQGSYPVSDSAAFEYIGRALNDGQTLYRDVWDNKPPGIYLANALLQRLFGEAYRGHAIAEALVALLSATLLASVMRSFRVYGRPYALVAQTVLLTLFALLNSTEAYALPLMLGSIIAVAAGRPIFGGLLAGAACLFWIPAGLMIVPLFSICDAAARARLSCALGATVILAAIAVLAMCGGSAAEQLFSSWASYVTTPAASSPHRSALLARVPAVFFHLYGGATASGIAGLFAVLAAVVRRPRTAAQRFGLMWVAAMIAATFLGTRFYAHYFIPVSAALLFSIFSFGFRRLQRPRMVVFLLIGLCFACVAVRDARAAFIDRRERSANVVRVSSVIRSRLNAPTIANDGYEPGLYLAIRPTLQNPYAVVAGASSFALRLAGRPRPADVFVSTGLTSEAHGTQVCAQQSGGWRIYAAPAIAPLFRGCS